MLTRVCVCRASLAAALLTTLPPDLSPAAGMAKRAVAATLLRLTGCVDTYVAASRAYASERDPTAVPPECLASVWATAAAVANVLFRCLESAPWTRQTRQQAGMQLSRRIAHNCSFLRTLHVQPRRRAVLRASALASLPLATMRFVSNPHSCPAVVLTAVVWSRLWRWGCWSSSSFSSLWR